MGIKLIQQAAPQLVQFHLLTESRGHILGFLLPICTLSQAAPSQQWSAHKLVAAVAVNMKVGSRLHLTTCAMVET